MKSFKLEDSKKGATWLEVHPYLIKLIFYVILFVLAFVMAFKAIIYKVHEYQKAERERGMLVDV